METWALQAHGAGHILQEMLTLKVEDEGKYEEICIDKPESEIHDPHE